MKKYEDLYDDRLKYDIEQKKVKKLIGSIIFAIILLFLIAHTAIMFAITLQYLETTFIVGKTLALMFGVTILTFDIYFYILCKKLFMKIKMMEL